MSTRCTIWYAKPEPETGLDIHLYSEAFDDSVCIEIEQGPVCVNFTLPQAMVKAIFESEVCKHYAEHGADTSWADQLPDLSKCPKCGGPADNGHDRCLPPNPYFCTKCESGEAR